MGSVTDFGFDWGPMQVQRLAHIEGRGYVLEVATETKVMQVYVSERGRKIEAYPVRDRAPMACHAPRSCPTRDLCSDSEACSWPT